MWISITTLFHYRVAEWIASPSTFDVELSAFTGMTLKKGNYFKLHHFLPLFTRIYHCYVYSENNALTYSVITLQAAHMHLENGVYHKYPLNENEMFSSPHYLYNIWQVKYIYCQDKFVESHWLKGSI